MADVNETITVAVDGDLSMIKVMDAIDKAVEIEYGSEAVRRMYEFGKSTVTRVTVEVKVEIPGVQPKPDK